MELGRWGRSMMMSAGAGGQAQRATGSSTIDRKICSTNSGGACSRSRSAAATTALNDHGFWPAFTLIAPLTRARGARRFQRAVRPSCAEQTDRLEPALRLLVDAAISF